MNTIEELITKMINEDKPVEQRAASIAALIEHIAAEYSFWTMNIFAYGYHTEKMRAAVYQDFLTKRILQPHEYTRLCEQYKRKYEEADIRNGVSLQPQFQGKPPGSKVTGETSLP